MNKHNAHLYIPYIQALGEGKTLQTCEKPLDITDGVMRLPYWKDCAEIIFNLPPECYRVKPEQRWYRVAELKTCKSQYIRLEELKNYEDQIIPVNIAWNELGEREVESDKSTFVRWLTERIKY